MDWKARAMAQVAQLEGLDEEVDKQDEGHKEGGNQEWGDDDKDAATTHSSLNSMGTSTASQGSSAGGDDSDREGGEGEDEDEGDVDDDGEDVEDEDRMAARSEEFSFPKWQVEWDAFGPRDFGISYRSYQKFKTSVEAKSKEKVASPPKELLLAGKRGLELQRAKQAKEIARIEARQRRDDERDQRKAEQLADKLEKAAEREKQKQVRLAERTEHQRKRDEAAREREEQRQKRQAEVEQRRKDREEERLKKKLEKEAADAKKRAAKKERGSFIDEELDTYHLDPPSGQAWDVDGPQIQTGELLAVWNFLATHTKLIACPFYSLSELRGALSIPARAAELTDLHVALMRVLLHDMDLIPDPATGQLADPPRTQLLTALTWPYMACMFLEENESRLGPIESKVSGMLWEMEYHKIEARWKLQLLSILCNECMSCEPCRSTVDDSRSYTSGKDRLSAKRHAMYDSTGRVLDKNEDEDDPDDGKPMHSSKHPRKMRFVRLVGTDRRRNRYFVLGDADGEPAMVVCQKIDVDIYNKAFGVADKFLPKPGDENVKGLLPPKKKAKAGGENGGGVGAVHVNGIAADAAGAGGEVGEAAGASAAGETAAAAAPKETATNEEAEAPVSRGVLYVADSGSEVQANAYASLTAEAYEHAEPQAHDTMRENWTVYASAAELGPLIRYLDPRGFREAALQFKLTDVENALQAREHARLQAVYDEVATGLSGKSTVKQVVRAICAALESAVAAEAARVRSFGIGQKVTVQSMKRQAPAASAWNAVSRLAESADVGAEPLPSEDDVGTRAYESAVLEQRFAADDLNGALPSPPARSRGQCVARIACARSVCPATAFGTLLSLNVHHTPQPPGRAVWAKPPSSQWWPATVVPLCAETVPSNVRKLGKQLNARRRKAHAASGADTAPPAKLVLVQVLACPGSSPARSLARPPLNRRRHAVHAAAESARLCPLRSTWRRRTTTGWIARNSAASGSTTIATPSKRRASRSPSPNALYGP
eukprot:SAG11_NODE_885_length_6732_cov_3.853309_1_plen_1000_part_00